jgi:hypothetical protein
VDSYLLSHEENLAYLIRDFINDNHYGDARVEKVNGDYRVLTFITMPTQQNMICSVSGLMACLAAIFKVYYDGWGCVLQGSNASGNQPLT